MKPSKEVRVAILDTGLNTKEGLNVEDLGINYSSTGESTSSSDDNGHGTEMAELISANSSSVKLVPIKVADSSGKATILNTYLGIKKAIELGVDVVNISMNTASTTTSEILTEAINEAVNSGIFVVVSAGNLGLDTSKVSPANVDSAIVVSAVNSDNTFANYSNYGNTIDYSAYGTYNGKTGTSYATARVSGIVADLLSKQGSLETLDKYAVDLGAEGKDPQFGKGLLTLETLQGSDEEDEADKIAKENKEKYEKLCANWKGMTDEELDEYFDCLNYTIIGFFLDSLSEDELKEILSRDTCLNNNIGVYPLTVVNDESEIPTEDSSKDSKSETKILYEYCMSLSEGLSISDSYADGTKWYTSGFFTLRFNGAGLWSGNKNNDYKISVSGVTRPGSNGTIELSENKNPEISITKSNSSAKDYENIGIKNGLITVDNAYLVNRSADNDKVFGSDWGGIYLKGLHYNQPAHTITSWSPISYDGKTRLCFACLETGESGDDAIETSHEKKDTARKTYVQCNSFNCGLAGSGDLHGIIALTFNLCYEQLTINPNGGKYNSTTSKTTLTKHSCGHTQTISNPTRSGYTFDGWSVSNGDGAKGSLSGKTYTYESSVALSKTTLKAKWTKKPTNTPKPTATNTPTPKATKPPSATNTPTPIPKYTVTYKYYRFDANADDWEEGPFATDAPLTYNKGTTITGASIRGKIDAKLNACKDTELKGYKFKPENDDVRYTSMTGTVCTLTDHTLNGNTVICIGYRPLELNLTIDTKDGNYKTAAGQSDKPLGLKFKYGVEKEFSSKDINNYVTGGMSLPVKKGYHLCDPYNETDVEYVNNSPTINSTQPWVLVDGATGNIIDSDTYIYDGMSAVDVTIEANWIPDMVDLVIDPNGGTLYGYDYNSGELIGWSSDVRTKRYTMGTHYNFASTQYVNLDPNAMVCFASDRYNFGTGKVDENAPDIPYREGYTFKGWTSNVGGTITEIVTSPERRWEYFLEADGIKCITLTAQWTPNKYNLIVDPNGGVAYAPDGSQFGENCSNKTWSREFTYGVWDYFCTGIKGYYSSDWNICSVPTKEGYVFEGWEVSPGGTVDQCLFGSWWDFHGDYAGDVTVKAKWKGNTDNVITVDPNGGEFYTPDSTTTKVSTSWSKEFEYGTRTCFAHDYERACDTSLKAVSQPTREGYAFAGWKQTVGGGTSTKEGIYNYFNGDYNGNVTFTAQWTTNYYPVTCYDTVENSSGIVLGTHTEDFAYGITVSGAHWGMDTSLGAYYAGYNLTDWTIAVVTTEGATVYRYFTKPVSGLNVNPNGGKWRGSTESKSFTGELDTTVDIPDPTISNYTAYFNGNGGTSDYSSKITTRYFYDWSETYPKGASLSAGTLDRVNKIFTFGSNENGRTDLTAIWAGSYSVKLPSAKWAGHDFIGWYTAPTGGTLVGIEGDYVTVKKDITYYAQWKASQTKITLSQAVDLNKVAFAKGNPVAVFKVDGTDVMGKKHTYIKTIQWDSSDRVGSKSITFTILSGKYTVTLLNQNEYGMYTPTGSSNVKANGYTCVADMSDGSESSVSYMTYESDYSKYTGNSLVTTSLK